MRDVLWLRWLVVASSRPLRRLSTLIAWLRAVAFLCAVCVGPVPVAVAAVSYVYDDVGRLVGVIDQISGESARYEYDSLGNIASIRRTAPNTVSIIEFTPRRGPAGTSVTIFGTGFSNVPAENAVSFNGPLGTVTSSSDNQIVVTVPLDATTGFITVTTPNGIATSDETFQVISAAGVPTITGFTPTIGSAGTTVTISGTNFDATLGATRVQFNQTLAGTTAISASSLTTSVPVNTGSGRIRLTTPAGSAVSATDFIVHPLGINAVDVVSIQRAAVGGTAVTLDIPTSNKIGLLLFDGADGSYLTVDLAQFLPTPSTNVVPYEIYTPRGVRLSSGQVSSTARSIHVPRLPAAGTYSIYFKPGPATASITALLTADHGLVVDGATVPGAFNFNGQSKRLLVSRAVAEDLGFGISELVLSPSSSTQATVTLYRPEGSSWTSTTCSVAIGSCGIPLRNLPSVGTYSIVIVPINAGTGTFRATLSSDLRATLAIDGSSLNVDVARPGQSASLSFEGTAGQNLGFGISSFALSPSAAASAGVTVYKPDGTLLTSVHCSTANSGCTTNLTNLPAIGTYRVVVTPSSGATSTFAVSLSSDVAGILTEGSPLDISLRPGQNARLRFAGNTGNRVTLALSPITIQGSSAIGNVSVFKPDGGLLGNYMFASGTKIIDLPVLAATGDYTVFIDPPPATVTMTVYFAVDTVVAINADGPSTAINITSPWQRAHITFAVAAGQELGFGISSLSLTPATSQYVTADLYSPSGSWLIMNTSCNLYSDGCGLNLSGLAEAGAYRIVVIPGNAGIGSFSATLSTDIRRTLSHNTALDLSVARPGQNARLSFIGEAGEALRLDVRSVIFTPSFGTAAITILNPNGTILASRSFSHGNALSFGLPLLPMAGTYTAFVDPPYSATGSMAVSLSRDVTAVLAVDGPPTNTELVQPGQSARLTFSATSGQNLGLGITNLTLSSGSSAAATVYRPDGSTWFSTTCQVSNGGCAFNLSNVPVNGNYNLTLTPPAGATGSLTVTLSSDIAGTLSVGTALDVVLSRPGQNARFAFAGDAGNYLDLSLYPATIDGSSESGYVSIFAPNGSLWAQGWFTNGNGLISLGLPPLPATGTYTLAIDPPHAATASMTVRVAAAPVVVVDGASLNLSTSVPGQIARVLFSGTAGQNVGVGITNLTASSGTMVSVTVDKPNGAELSWNNQCRLSDGACRVSLSNLPTTGTYVIKVRSYDGVGTTMSFTTTLSSDVTGALIVDSPTNLVLARPGQYGRLTLAANAGDVRIINFRDVVVSPSNLPVSIAVYRPDGTWLNSATATNGSNTNFDLGPLPMSGTYSVLVGAWYHATASMTVALATNVVTPVAVDGPPAEANITQPGQGASFTFNGTQGQRVDLGISDLSLSGGSATVTVYRPGGTASTTFTCLVSNGGCGTILLLDATGMHSVLISPANNGTGSLKVTLSTQLSGTLTKGAPSTINLRAGQNARLTFSGTAGEYVGVRFSAVNLSSSSIGGGMVWGPDGALHQNISFSNGNETAFALRPLPLTGTYTLFLDPPHGATTTLTVLLSGEITSTAQVDGATIDITIPRYEQAARVTFSGTSGQSVGYAFVAKPGMSPSTVLSYYIYYPDGTASGLMQCNIGAVGCDTAFLSLPATGTYTLIFLLDAPGSFAVTLSSDVTRALTANNAFNLNIARPGQNARLTFSGTAGQKNRTLTVSSIITNPTARPIWVYVFAPSKYPFGLAMVIRTITGNSATISLPTLPETGTYSIYINPEEAATATMTVKISR